MYRMMNHLRSKGRMLQHYGTVTELLNEAILALNGYAAVSETAISQRTGGHTSVRHFCHFITIVAVPAWV